MFENADPVHTRNFSNCDSAVGVDFEFGSVEQGSGLVFLEAEPRLVERRLSIRSPENSSPVNWYPVIFFTDFSSRKILVTLYNSSQNFFVTCHHLS